MTAPPEPPAGPEEAAEQVAARVAIISPRDRSALLQYLIGRAPGLAAEGLAILGYHPDSDAPLAYDVQAPDGTVAILGATPDRAAEFITRHGPATRIAIAGHGDRA